MTAIESSRDVDRIRDYIDVFDNNVLLPAFAAAIKSTESASSDDDLKARLTSEATRLMELSRVQMGQQFPHLTSAANHIAISAINQLLSVASSTKQITGRSFSADAMLDMGRSLVRRNWLGSVLMGAYKARDGVDSVAPGRVTAMKKARNGWITNHNLEAFSPVVAQMYQQISDNADKYQEALFASVGNDEVALGDIDQVGIFEMLDVSPFLFQKAIILGASGVVGAGMSAALAQQNGAQEIVAVDSVIGLNGAHSVSRVIVANVLAPLEPAFVSELNDADLIIAALPSNVLYEALPVIAPHLKSGALVVETLSAKLPLFSVLKTLPDHVEVLGIEPMAAPTPSLANTPVLVMDYGTDLNGEHSERFVEWLRSIDCPVLECDFDAHGDLITSMQSLPHACVMAYGFAGTRTLRGAIDDGDIPAMLLARMAQLSPETYWEIQTENEAAPKARHSVIRILDQIDEWVSGVSFGEFADACSSVTAALGGRVASASAPISLAAVTTELVFALTLAQMNSDVSSTLPFGTPPYRSMVMGISQLMTMGPDQLFELQQGSEAQAVRSALREGLTALDALTQAGDRDGFYRQMAGTFEGLGQGRLAALQGDCQKLFTQTVPDFFRAQANDTVKKLSGLEAVCEPF